MMKTNVLVFISLLYFVSFGDAYFYVPTLVANSPYISSMATALGNNNTLYMFGGEGSDNLYNSNLYKLTKTNESFEWNILQQKNAPPGTTFGQAVVTYNNSKMYLLGGVTDSTFNQNLHLQYYQYTFDTSTWTAAPTNTISNFTSNVTDIPANRKLFSATYDNKNRIYIYGGAINQSTIFSNFYSMDTITGTFTELVNPNISRYSHTASLLSTGQIVIIGGVFIDATNGSTYARLAPMDQVSVYDTITNQWDIKKIGAAGPAERPVLPSARADHLAVVTPDDKIVVFGGSNGGTEKSSAFLNAIAILDTKTWSWTVPSAKGIPAARRAFASGGLVDRNYLTVAFGKGPNTYYSDINVFDLSTNEWLQTFDKPVIQQGLSAGAIAGITIASTAALVLILFLLWKFKNGVRWLFRRIHKEVWRPRTGEPVWTEMTRIISQFLFLLVFVAFLVFIILQAINSPVVTQSFEEITPTVQSPDVRFCFDGFPIYDASDSRAISVTCHTDTGYACTSFIQPLNMSIFQPTFTGNLGNTTCYMFRAPKEFVLTSTSGVNNGSKLLFGVYADQNANGLVYISIYPKVSNPNAVMYEYNDDTPNLISTEDVLDWLAAEKRNTQLDNFYTLKPSTYTTLGYKLIDYQYLLDVGWNYFGFLPITKTKYEIATKIRQDYRSGYTAQSMSIGYLSVFPEAFVQTYKREVKINTLLNALGFVGGVFGLFVAAQVWLFGFRPKSPWGVVQRWSVGSMKQSLFRGLRSKFKTSESGVPLVHPFHQTADQESNIDSHGIAGDEQETKRMMHRMQERMQMLETLFREYYVDDEVFRSLDEANKSSGGPDEPKSMSNHNQQDSDPQTEKLVNDDGSNNTSKRHLDRLSSLGRRDNNQRSSSEIPLTLTKHTLSQSPTDR